MPPAKVFNPESPCPCGSQQLLNVCCLPFIQLRAYAPTAERLMRSRYTAHVLLEIDFLWETWSPEQRLRSSKDDIRAWAASCEWFGYSYKFFPPRQGLKMMIRAWWVLSLYFAKMANCSNTLKYQFLKRSLIAGCMLIIKTRGLMN